MYDRTITISTFGKTFSVTGWKIGWTIAPAPLTEAILRVRLYSSGSGTTPVQVAAANALEAPPSFYTQLREEYTARRQLCTQMLQDSGFIPFIPDGTFFMMADYSPLEAQLKPFVNDVDFCQYLTETIGVTAIPGSALYHHQLPQNHKLVRFAFCKKMQTLQEAQKRFSKIPNLDLLSSQTL
jgi:aspartate/methionine/tyrosine aminotransferase